MTRGLVGERGWRRNVPHVRPSGRVLLACLCSVALMSGPLLGPASAELEPGSPIVHCGWVLPDTDAGPTFTYGPDDDVTTVRLAGAPCTLTDDGNAFQPSGAAGLTHIVVDPDLIGSTRTVEFWAAVSDPASDAFASGSGTVSWSVRGPDGSLVGDVAPDGRSCAGSTTPGPMWEAASDGPAGAGVLAAETVKNDDGTGLWQACRQGRVRMFSGRLTLASGMACGSYSVTTTATVAEKSATLGYTFEVLCATNVVLDAGSVHWNVAPGGIGIVKGDDDPTTGTAPTVTNNGPNPVQIGLLFTPLRRSDAVVNDAIAEFGGLLSPLSSLKAGIPRIVAGESAWFTGPASVVCPGKSVPIDVSVHAPADLADGEYEGTFQVLARAGGRC